MTVSHVVTTLPEASTGVGATIAPPLTAEHELLKRLLRRAGVERMLERIGVGFPISVRITTLDGTVLVATDNAIPSGDSPHLWGTAWVQHAECKIAVVAVAGLDSQISGIAHILALWLQDLLAFEEEVGSLTQEVVHAYEELHVLYELGNALSGVLDLQAACDLIVTAVLAPLRAAQATLTLIQHGSEHLVARATNPEAAAPGSNLQDRVATKLQVNGELIGSLEIVGTLAGPEFRSGDLKLLTGVASVASPALYAAQLYETARHQADTDGLTGVENHRRIQERIEVELDRARRYGHPLTIILADLDNFKLFNDVYGHPVGDRVLQTVTECLRASMRSSDIVGRYGGDEFLLVLPETTPASALELAQRLLATVAEQDIVVNTARLPIGISLGIASYPEDAATKHELIAHADAALYESKRNGGHTVRHAEAPRADWLTLQSNTYGVLEGLVQSVDAKDHYTRQHSEAVTEAALLLAQRLNLSEETRRALRIAGLLHDVGKIGIPDHVLKKPAKLTEAEYLIMQQHVQLSEMMIKNVPYLTDVLDAVAHHHERYDGQGYPYGKHQEAIPLLGRIMAIADAYSAMSMDRPYRKGLRWQEIRAELEDGAGTQFDPRLVMVFIAAMEEVSGRADRLHELDQRSGAVHTREH